MRQTIFAMGIALVLAAPAPAGDFNGKKTLLCNSTQIFECHADQGCEAVPSEEYGAARQFVLDFRKKTLDTSAETPQVSEIQRVQASDTHLYVQGIDDDREDGQGGAAWSFAISEPNGIMVATVAQGDGTAFVIEGFCVKK